MSISVPWVLAVFISDSTNGQYLSWPPRMSMNFAPHNIADRHGVPVVSRSHLRLKLPGHSLCVLDVIGRFSFVFLRLLFCVWLVFCVCGCDC